MIDPDLPEDWDSSEEEESDGSWLHDKGPQASTSDHQETHDEANLSSKTAPISLSVHRSEISSTVIQEGADELECLNVQAYDQQTYEEGVFAQVNEAISKSSTASKGKQDQVASRMSNLMGIIQSQGNSDDGEEDQDCDPIQRDEQILLLARQERLSRPIKKEITENYVVKETFGSTGRIPKLLIRIKQEPIVRVKIEPGSSESCDRDRQSLTDQGTSSTQRPKRYRIEPVEDDLSEDRASSSETHTSDYRPSESESESEEDFDEDVVFESDEADKRSDDDLNDTSESTKRKRICDDGNFIKYERRIKKYTRERAKKRLANILSDGTEVERLDEQIQVEGDLHIPKELWDDLFEHQKTGVKWLWELHQVGSGGILGDEMGLGKTIQTIAFLTALKTSNIVSAHKGYKNLGPTVLVCPATVMHQWLAEFRKWWPKFRVAILHNTGSFSGEMKNLVQIMNKANGILIVSYGGVVIYQDYLHDLDWHYVILDEGHKIRNPDAQVTLACKRFRTPHRIILSGSPVQNNLKELWSIFDFIYPGKLGTLPIFMEKFGTPITQGGYANASDFQVQIAYKCTCVLRDTIKPFLLRRTKAEVKSNLKLPNRSEQVLFCKLTDRQRKLYESYLNSPTIRDIKRGFCQIFVGLIELRKICNHPDLFDASECTRQARKSQPNHGKKLQEFLSTDETYGHYKKSGKMMVVDALLKIWKKKNHRVLLFTQSRQMLKLFVVYLNELGYKHMVMDGTTPIGARQTMIHQFNTNEENFIFLLTTKVGGVGVNLTGADRIIIFDPDWNPSTDIQARERAWRIGQEREVIIYRLLTAGTIEEKIYHRQVFKLYLTNRVLRDAKQKRFFKTNDLHELFKLGDDDKNIETQALFDDDLHIKPESLKRSREEREAKKKKKKEKREKSKIVEGVPVLSEAKLDEMRKRAKMLSQMIATKYGNGSKDEASKERLEPDVRSSGSIASTSKSRSFKFGADMKHDGPSSSKKDKSMIKQKVDFLVKQDVYQHDAEDTKRSSSKTEKREDYILEQLFRRSDIFGALKHDKIETDTTSDFKVVESEAERVARDAIRALRESRRTCLGSSTGVPNWTGRNGQSAAPRLVPRNKSRVNLGDRSKHSAGDDSILSAIKKRNQMNPVSLFQGNNSSDEEGVNRDFLNLSDDAGATSMVAKIRDYILFGTARNGEAQTDEILTLFKNSFKPNQTAIFKALLHKMCKFHRKGAVGFWSLNPEYRDF